MPLATLHSATQEYVFTLGKDRPDVAWILSPYDTWHKNPYYVGAPVPHPEDNTD
jgi:hypothetical protein